MEERKKVGRKKRSKKTRREGADRAREMCKIIKNLQGKTADELLREVNMEQDLPIDIVELLGRLGISSVPMNFENITKDRTVDARKILGAVVSNGSNLAIFYDNTASLNRKRFTMAHELAHCCLHIDPEAPFHIEWRTDEKDKNPKEKATDIFAGELLIPANKLQEVYDKLLVPYVETLAELFAVSKEVMKARLEYLGMGVEWRNKECST